MCPTSGQALLHSLYLPPLPPAPTGQARLHSLTLFFASLLYQGTSRSLFDEDRLPFAVFLMARYMVVSVMSAGHVCGVGLAPKAFEYADAF